MPVKPETVNGVGMVWNCVCRKGEGGWVRPGMLN